MSPVDIIALIFAIIVLVKMLFFFTADQKKWLKLVDSMFKHNVVLTVVFLVLAIVVGALLLKEINVVQLWAGALFGILLIGLVFSQYSKGFLEIFHDVFKDKKKAWLPWLVFILMALWVLYYLFA